MPQSLTRITVHLIFSTKKRASFLSERAIRSEMHSVLGGLCNTLGCPTILVGGVDDHVHIACHLGRTLTVADLIKELKRESSQWAKQRANSLLDFHWQSGYSAFSVSQSHVDALVEYIRDQEEHHRREGFQDELRRILEKNNLEWDERYLWD
ncbi:MAG: IS200/IS605 family transposase [Planctomycetaceae bacterium]|jgi:REP element-mobilizing transposase RayT